MKKKILVIGSGPIVIGQAAEFDYSGSQCLQVLKELGHETILFNSNPATIMTDASFADRVYMEPMNAEFLKKVLIKERPDGILASFGGQIALNLVKDLWFEGFLQKNQIEILGSDIDSIQQAEDRQLFRKLMQEMNVPVPSSEIVNNIEDGINAAESIGLPVIVRPAYTLGGSGGGIASNLEELKEILHSGLEQSSIHQCLVEKSIAGFKEIEYEVIRDQYDNAITVCNMENLDPVGVHTGDSIVFAPSQTLNDRDYHHLREVSLAIDKKLKVIGACNVQLAQDPKSSQYYIIEVNPRVSRSSALASKATGFPIAKIATYACLGFSLDEIQNPITQKTYACFEPALDYVVCKFPRFAYDKFPLADRALGSQMKATGEVMSLAGSLEEALLKCVRGLEQGFDHLYCPRTVKMSAEQLEMAIQKPSDLRIFQIAQLMRLGYLPRQIHELTQIDMLFLQKIDGIIKLENKIDLNDAQNLWQLKNAGFSDSAIARLTQSDVTKVRQQRQHFNITAKRKMVDSCAAEFPAATPYYYLSYRGEDEENVNCTENQKKVLVIGSGPIRIGQGIEFDYSSVHALQACQKQGLQTIMINNNPETCSTDFSFSDSLYFEAIDAENILSILHKEKPCGVLVQFGGQTAINLAQVIEESGLPILGTSFENLKKSEDREQFEHILNQLNIARPKAYTLGHAHQVRDLTSELDYPVMIRPSYVLGGQSMEIVFNEQDLIEATAELEFSTHSPLLIDQYIKGMEIEVDAISDGHDVFIPGIMEHLERAGVHSGDSIALYPPRKLYSEVQDQVIKIVTQLGRTLQIKGLMNLQFMYKKGELYIIELNPRASRTIPFLTKMTKVPISQIATQVALGSTLKELGYSSGLHPYPNFYSIKVPVFSFEKLPDVEPALGPQMKSTGEVLGRDQNFAIALYKGLLAQGLKIPQAGNVLLTISDRYKEEVLELAQRLSQLNFQISATEGTAHFLKEHNIECTLINKIREPAPNLLTLLRDGYFDIIINTLSRGKQSNRDGYLLRRKAAQMKLPFFTSLDTAYAFLEVLEHRHVGVQSL